MNSEILARYADQPMPRYTSYPTAPHFAPLEQSDYRAWLAEVPTDRPISLYAHIPFCRSMCWYCGCHTTITARDEPIARYLDAIRREMELAAAALPARISVGHVHFGGGTPTLMAPHQFIDLMALMGTLFRMADGAEVAIEIDPRTLEPAMIEALAQGGVNRASLGVQSFDPKVQQAINRVQTFAQTRDATEGLRSAGINGINFDLIYGLPHQDVTSCLETVREALLLEPDRFAVFGYAHVPSFKLHQRKIEEAALPDGAARHEQAEAIADALAAAGYVRIGLDHFARPDDPLARAATAGGLHRNFQGYTTDPCDTLIGFGASSIGRLPRGFVQNAVLIGDYQRRVAAGELAVSKGRAFAAQDRVRAALIERIMCDFAVDLDAVCAPYGEDGATIAAASPTLPDLIDQGLVTRHSNRLVIADAARPLVRVVAAAFDQYLGHGPARHSRAV